jgi:hypothetical protein
LVNSLSGAYNRSAGTVTGFDLLANLAPSLNVDYNGVTQTNSTNDLSAVSTSILGPQYTPWARPIWETLPDPLGANWRTERVGNLIVPPTYKT